MKRTIMLRLIGLLSLNAAMSLLAQAATSDVETAIAGMEQQWTQAQSTNNAAALGTTYVADTAVIVDDALGRSLIRNSTSRKKRRPKYTHAAISDVVVHGYGTAAVATYV